MTEQRIANVEKDLAVVAQRLKDHEHLCDHRGRVVQATLEDVNTKIVETKDATLAMRRQVWAVIGLLTTLTGAAIWKGLGL